MYSTPYVLHNGPDKNRVNWSESGDSTTAWVHLVGVAVKWVGAPISSYFFSKKNSNKQGSKRTVLTYPFRLCCTPEYNMLWKSCSWSNPQPTKFFRENSCFFVEKVPTNRSPLNIMLSTEYPRLFDVKVVQMVVALKWSVFGHRLVRIDVFVYFFVINS